MFAGVNLCFFLSNSFIKRERKRELLSLSLSLFVSVSVTHRFSHGGKAGSHHFSSLNQRQNNRNEIACQDLLTNYWPCEKTLNYWKPTRDEDNPNEFSFFFYYYLLFYSKLVDLIGWLTKSNWKALNSKTH
jgi:hypothetical protein